MVVVVDYESFPYVQSCWQRDDNFDTANNDDGDDDKKKPVNDRDDSVDGVDTNRHISTNKEPTTADPFLVFSGVVNANLPAIVFLSGGSNFFAMVAMNDEILCIQPDKSKRLEGSNCM